MKREAQKYLLKIQFLINLLENGNNRGISRIHSSQLFYLSLLE